jgi:Ca-activated chloride channel homolog
VRLLSVLLFAASAWTQTSPAFHSNVELVAIPCSVVDEHGAAVSGLTREEFRVFDNGVRRVVENLWNETDAPLTLGIVIDASESQHGQLAEHRRTALDLLEKLMKPDDRAFVILVDGSPRLWADVSGTVGELRRQMDASNGNSLGTNCSQRVCGQSPIWNAVYDAARLKLRSVTGSSKALLILTDGFDSGSSHNWQQALDEVQRAEASVYAVQYTSQFGGKYAPDLYRLVDASGGAWFPPDQSGSLFERLETDLRHRYVLGVRPELVSSRVRHDVRVEVTRPDLSVRARKTYYRTPQ